MTINDRYPGLPDYTGPKSGWFTLLHHEEPFEWSGNVDERLDYIDENKPANEVPIRRRHIAYVGPDKPWVWAEYERVKAQARAEVSVELHRLIPDCRWNGSQIDFGESR